MIGTHPIQLVFAGHCVAMVLFPSASPMVIVENLFLLGQGPGREGPAPLPTLTAVPGQAEFFCKFFLSVVKVRLWAVSSFPTNFAGPAGQEGGRNREGLSVLSDHLRTVHGPSTSPEQGCFLTVHHRVTSRHTTGSPLPSGGSGSKPMDFRLTVMAYFVSMKSKDFLLGQRMVRSDSREDLRDPHNGHLTSSVTLISCHPNPPPSDSANSFITDRRNHGEKADKRRMGYGLQGAMYQEGHGRAAQKIAGIVNPCKSLERPESWP